jgi:hypothetical protein
MESWRQVWRVGLAPQISTAGLEALRSALIADDSRLIQGSTTTPPPLMCVLDWPVEAACAIGFCGWQGDKLQRVEQVERYFAERCANCDHDTGEDGGVRHFLNWFDDTPRVHVLRELLPEVERELSSREVNHVRS